MTALRVTFPYGGALELYLALQRELAGRCSWEVNLLPRPVEPEIAAFSTGLRRWRALGVPLPPAALGDTPDPASMLSWPGSGEVRAATRVVVRAMHAAEPYLGPALAAFRRHRDEAAADLDRRLRLGRVAGPLTDATGTPDVDLTLPLHLVPFAPYPPAVGFLLDDDGRPAGGYLDCRRYVGGTLAEAASTQLAWAALRSSRAPERLTARLRRLLPGDGPYPRRLRLLLTKILIELTAGHLVREGDPDHRPGVDVLGTAWRFPRLHDLAARHWSGYLDGVRDRDGALSALAREAAAHHPRWYVDHVDGGSLAADFYLLEWLAARGDRGARQRLSHWVPMLSRDFAAQLDLIVGTELGHYERAPVRSLPAPLAEFVTRVNAGDSRVAWWRTRRELGEAVALDHAVDAFAGPGLEYGGEAWAPIAAMLRRFVTGELPERVFVDQCFTLEHHNGCLFDKYFEAEHLPAVLAAQADGNLHVLARHASAEVRWRWRRYLRRIYAGHSPAWLAQTGADATGADATGADGTGADGTGAPDDPDGVGSGRPEWSAAGGRLALGAAPPGSVGCGSAEEPDAYRPVPDPAEPVAARTWRFRRPWPTEPRVFRRVDATLETEHGPVRLRLWPEVVPRTVSNFVALAEGTQPWRDPVTGVQRREPFYDGTTFYRRLPGFLVQAGDRSGTGDGGPGYRIPDELPFGGAFDRPFLAAMANHGGDSGGSRFFITLAPAPHLDGGYQQFGEVADDGSREVLRRIASAAAPVTIRRVRIDAA